MRKTSANLGVHREATEMDNIGHGVSRRTVLIAAVTAAPVLALSQAQAASLPPTAVGYRDSPNSGKECSGCNLFVEPSSCKSVSGTISPHGWCKLWVKKA